jgi:NADPH:quinone reductase-like Zn-dependent oxidoreductase
MRAMVFDGGGPELHLRDLPVPEPGKGQVLFRDEACGVCRTDLHVVDGDLKDPSLPLIPGHEIVGRVERVGKGVSGPKAGQRVGVPWLGHTCGSCRYCVAGQENLCDAPGFTGYTINGGYAEYCVADAHFVFPLRGEQQAASLAPLLCAGLIGYRSLKLAGRGSAITDSARRPKSFVSLPVIALLKFSLSRGKGTARHRNSPSVLGRVGREGPPRPHPSSLTPRSFSRRWAGWFRSL